MRPETAWLDGTPRKLLTRLPREGRCVAATVRRNDEAPSQIRLRVGAAENSASGMRPDDAKLSRSRLARRQTPQCIDATCYIAWRRSNNRSVISCTSYESDLQL